MKRTAVLAVLLVALFALSAVSADPIDKKEETPDVKVTDKQTSDQDETIENIAAVDDSEDVDEDVNNEADVELATPEQEEDEQADVEESAPEEEEEEDDLPSEEDLAEEDSEEKRHGRETNSIRKLLNSIKGKLNRELKAAQRLVSKVRKQENRKVARAQAVYNSRARAARNAVNSRNRSVGSLRAAKRNRVVRINRARKIARARADRKERELLLIHSIECRLYALNGSNAAARRCVRSYRHRHSRYRARMSTRGIFGKTYSGYCASHSRGSGWARYCTNRHEFNQAGAFLRVRSNGIFTAKRSGFFRLHFKTIQYCRNWGQQDLRTIVNGRQINYAHKNHQHSWTHNENNMVTYIKAGQNFHFQAYCARCSNPYRWHSGNGRGAHSRVQVTYLGGSAPTWSATCSRHKRRGWHRYCTNRLERINSHFFKHTGSGVTIKRDGMYRINARSIVYTRGWGPHHARAHVSGRRVAYTHDYNVYWTPAKIDVVWPLKKGDHVSVDYYSNNGYAYHSGNRNGAHSRFQVTYEGPRSMPVASHYCASHARGARSWKNYCLNRKDFNTARNFLRVHGSGQVDVLRTGTYRINAWALQHTGSYCNRNARMLINGSYYSYGYDHARSWNRNGHDLVWRLKKGWKLNFQYYVRCGSSPYAFHNGHTHSRVQIMWQGRY